MKMKNLLLTIAATIGTTALTMAQNVPNYVPTNGLVGWWPFNGNANDESGNNLNGIVNGATLTSDRYNNNNNAYYFNGSNNYIEIFNDLLLNLTDSVSFSAWIKTNDFTLPQYIVNKSTNGTSDSWLFDLSANPVNIGQIRCIVSGATTNLPYSNSLINQNNTWYNVVATYDRQSVKFYINGSFSNSVIKTAQTPINSKNVRIGAPQSPYNTNNFYGTIDDIGIWNRALTQQEITALYNAANCSNNTTITPPTNTLNTGSIATFNASTSDPNPSYVWQSDFGQGFQTLNNIGNYSGVNSATLNIANVQLSAHNQPIRVITTSGNCIDTSNVAVITIADTCINTITDTTLITVTDTLLIHTIITGTTPPNNQNTIKVFPNPTNDHITIDYGNFSLMNGYQLKIENSLGQQVFQTNINQQSDYLSLANWGGNGLYFVRIIDPQGNTIDIRKIVLQ